MFAEVLLFFLAGTALGVVAGLLPGLHPNTVLVITVSLLWFSPDQPSYPVLAFIASISVSNAIVNFIPSIMLGAPEPDSVLSVLPGHRLLMRGRGYEALFLTVTGSVCAVLLTLPALPFVLWFIPIVSGMVHAYMHWLLIAVLATLLIKESRRRTSSLFIFIFTGMAGFMLLSALPSDQVLFPAFTGLFGISIIITSVAQSAALPEQKIRQVRCRWTRGSLAGWLAGMFVGILPGIGSAQAGVLASRALRGKQKDFMVALGGIATANMVFTFIALYSLGKTRSGAAWAVSQMVSGITLADVCFIMLISLLTCFTCSIKTLRLGRLFMKRMQSIDYGRLNIAVLAFLIVLLAVFSGLRGILIASVCTIIGLCCGSLGVK